VAKDRKEKTKKEKGDGFFKKIGRLVKSVYSELKKVSWPKFPYVLKNTGVVLAVVAVFLLILLGFDMALGWGVYDKIGGRMPRGGDNTGSFTGLGTAFQWFMTNTIGRFR
jgi:preprotein translocase SecE subunit